MAELELSSKKRQEIIDVLTRITDGNNESYGAKKDSQLYAIYKHVTEERNKYIQEIRAFERLQQIEPTPVEELSRFKNKDLREIGVEYGLYEPKEKRVETTNNSKRIVESDIECVERSIEELRSMFGVDADLMSDEELYKYGIRLEPTSYSKKYSEEKVNLIKTMIHAIIVSGLQNESQEPYNAEILEYLSYENLRELYEQARIKCSSLEQIEVLELKLKK